jgi:GWxTD domain-containing protein
MSATPFSTHILKAFRHICFLSIVITIVAGCTSERSFYQTNARHQYDPVFPVELRYRVIAEGNTLYSIFIETELKKLSDDIPTRLIFDKYLITYRLFDSYESRKPLKIDTLGDGNLIYKDGNIFKWFFKVEKPNVPNFLVVVRVEEKGSPFQASFDIPIYTQNHFIFYKYAIFPKSGRFPICSTYISTSDTIRIFTFPRSEKTLYLKHFPVAFPVSLPPMAQVPPATDEAAKNYNLYTIETERQIFMPNPGLYYIQEDTNALDGMSFYVAPHKFPLVTTPLELAEPLIYISTRDERRKMLNAEQTKLALDNYWLNLAGSREHGRKVIRAYYENVQQANRYFTHYKPGWKTDQGMVYIVFGPPDRVTKTFQTEEWYYGKGSIISDVSFFFDRRPTIFTPANFEIRRNMEYDRVWYSTVELWRKGNIKN